MNLTFSVLRSNADWKTLVFEHYRAETGLSTKASELEHRSVLYEARGPQFSFCTPIISLLSRALSIVSPSPPAGGRYTAKFDRTHHLEHVHTRSGLHIQPVRQQERGANCSDADIDTGMDVLEMVDANKFSRYANVELEVTEFKNGGTSL